MVADARRLRQHGDVEMVDLAALRPHQRTGMGEELIGGRAAPLLVGGREMGADIAVGDGAEQRVGQGVQRHVAVGMGEHAAVGGDLDAAEPDMVALGEGVDVEAGAEAGHVSGHGSLRYRGCFLRESPIRLDQVRGLGDLAVSGVALEDDDGQAGPFGESAVVRETVPALGHRPAMRVEQGAEPETLRGLHRAQVLAGRRLVNAADAGGDRLHQLDRIGHGHAGYRCAVLAAGLDGAGDQGLVDEGAGGVMHQHQIRRAGPCQPFEPRRHRLLAGRTARHRLRQFVGEIRLQLGDTFAEEVGRVRSDHRLDPADARGGGQSRQRAGQDGAPADAAILLGQIAADAQALACRDDDSGHFRPRGAVGHRRTSKCIQLGTGGMSALIGGRMFEGKRRRRLRFARVWLLIVQNET